MSEMNIWNRIKLLLYRAMRMNHTEWGDGKVSRKFSHTYEYPGTYDVEFVCWVESRRQANP